MPADQAAAAIEKLQAEAKRLLRDVSQLKTKVAMGGGGEAALLLAWLVVGLAAAVLATARRRMVRAPALVVSPVR